MGSCHTARATRRFCGRSCAPHSPLAGVLRVEQQQQLPHESGVDDALLERQVDVVLRGEWKGRGDTSRLEGRGRACCEVKLTREGEVTQRAG